MAVILKKQKSLYISALKYIVLAFVVAIVGRMLLFVYVYITILTIILFALILGKAGNFLLGAMGEYLVTRQLKKLGDDYYIINDINLPEMQIDHVLVCPKGIITLETKTYVGKIYGNGNKKYWKYIGKNKFSIPIYSPIKQGRAHSVKLHERLVEQGLPRNIYINTIVVFAGIAKIKVRPRPIPILYCREVYDHIDKMPDILKSEEITRYKEAIIKLLK